MKIQHLFLLASLGLFVFLQTRSFGQESVEPVRHRPASENNFHPDEFLTLRSQLLAFAPYVSMHSRFRFSTDDQSDAAAVLTEWTDLRKSNEDLFNSHAQLKTAYRDIRAFMVRTESSAIPMLQEVEIPELSINPLEQPELALAELILVISAETARNERLNAWSRDHDATCRADYARILPLLRRVFEKPTEGPELVHLRHWFVEGKGVYLEALNLSGQTLHNVTLSIRLLTIDGTSSDHYYFIPEWPAEQSGSDQHRYPLRIASDWSNVGAAATTSARLEVLSDEYVHKIHLFRFDDNIPTAADRVLGLNDAVLKTGKKPAVVIERARKLERQLGAYPERRERAKNQRNTAQNILNTATGHLDQKIIGLRKSIKDINSTNIRWKNKSRKARADARQKLRVEIKKYEKEKLAWKSGRR